MIRSCCRLRWGMTRLLLRNIYPRLYIRDPLEKGASELSLIQAPGYHYTHVQSRADANTVASLSRSNVNHGQPSLCRFWMHSSTLLFRGRVYHFESGLVTSLLWETRTRSPALAVAERQSAQTRTRGRAFAKKTWSGK